MDFWGLLDYDEKKCHPCENCKVKTDLWLPYCQENSTCLKLNLQFLLDENLKCKKELEKYKK